MPNLADFLRAQAAEHGDRPLVRFRDESLTFREFDERTDAIAAGLAASGVKPGDVVSVFLPNHIRYLEAWWGILKAGGVFGPVNPAFTAVRGALRHLLLGVGRRDHRPTRAREIVDAIRDDLADGRERLLDRRRLLRRAARVRRRGPEPATAQPEDLAHILYTSGTTGQPKGAMLSHHNVLTNAWQAAELVPLAPGDRLGMILPLFHANAQIVDVRDPADDRLRGRACGTASAAKTFWQTVKEHRRRLDLGRADDPVRRARRARRRQGRRHVDALRHLRRGAAEPGDARELPGRSSASASSRATA